MAVTPKNNIPYPDYTGRVSRTPYYFHQLADRLDEIAGEMGGLIQISNYKNLHGRVVRTNKLCTAFVDISRTGDAFTAGYGVFVQFATIPREFRPDRDTWAGFVQIRSGGDIALVRAGRDGKLELYPQGKSMRIGTGAAITGVLTWSI